MPRVMREMLLRSERERPTQRSPPADVTLGPSYGSKQFFGRTALSALAGAEQPITKPLSLIVDWFSGSRDLAALVPAVQWNVSHSFIVIAGVKLPNTPRAGPISGLVELTYELDIK